MSDVAYAIIVLHALKHPSNISGVLLGTAADDGCAIESALPLIHSDLAMFTAPMHEMALLLSEHKARQHNQQIVGVYYSNALSHHTAVPPVAALLADAVQARCPAACLLMVHAAAAADSARERRHALRLVVARAQGRRPASASSPQQLPQRPALRLSDRAPALADGLVAGRFLRRERLALADFEDHCNNPRADWLNVALSRQLAAVRLSPRTTAAHPK